jgi:hypothetical protein
MEAIPVESKAETDDTIFSGRTSIANRQCFCCVRYSVATTENKLVLYIQLHGAEYVCIMEWYYVVVSVLNSRE